MYLAAGRPADAANALDMAMQKDKAREIRLKLLCDADAGRKTVGRRQTPGL